MIQTLLNSPLCHYFFILIAEASKIHRFDPQRLSWPLTSSVVRTWKRRRRRKKNSLHLNQSVSSFIDLHFKWLKDRAAAEQRTCKSSESWSRPSISSHLVDLVHRRLQTVCKAVAIKIQREVWISKTRDEINKVYFSSNVSHVQEKLLNISKYQVKAFYKVTHLQHQTFSVKLETQNQPVI